jgi:acetyl esterase/lipase
MTVLVGADVVVHEQVLYRTTPQGPLALDLYLPRPAAAPHPALLYLFGGGWYSGATDQGAPLARTLAGHGYAVAAAQYRLVPQAYFPAPVADAKAAVRWLRRQAATYGLDGARISVIGPSSGGHLAAMVATTGHTSLFLDGDAPDDQGESSAAGLAVLICAITDMRTAGACPYALCAKFLNTTLDEDPECFCLASPITHVSAQAPATLLLHSDADPLAPYASAVAFRDALHGCGVEAMLFIPAGAPHRFHDREPWEQPSTEAILTFLQRHWS